MVKFSKELEAQLIPEWSDAFVKYRELKKQVKKIKLSRLPKQPQDMMGGDFGLSIFDPVRFFAMKICDKFRNPGNETDIIQVHYACTQTCKAICMHVFLCKKLFKIVPIDLE